MTICESVLLGSWFVVYRSSVVVCQYFQIAVPGENNQYFCGSDTFSVESTTSSITIRLETDSSVTKRGFRLEWTSTSNGMCLKNLESYYMFFLPPAMFMATNRALLDLGVWSLESRKSLYTVISLQI